MIDDLYERIADLRSKLYWHEDVENLVREKLLHSTISIEECENIFYFLNLPDNQLEPLIICRGNETELFRILEVI